MTDFEEELARLVSGELAEAREDPERYATIIERLAGHLGFAIAMAARGDAKMIDEFITASEDFAHATAVDLAPMSQLIANSIRPRKDQK